MKIDKIIQIINDSSDEGYLLFGLGESGMVYMQHGNEWMPYIKNPVINDLEKEE